MEENKDHIEPEKTVKPKKRRFGRIVLWSMLVTLSLIVVFQLIFLFYSDQLFGRVLKEIVFQSSNGIYTVTYKDVKFNVFKNEIEFTELALNADSVKFQELEYLENRSNRLIDFSSPFISIQGPSLIKLYFDKILTINEFDVDNPNLKMRVYGEFRSGQTGLRNFHEILSQYIAVLKVKEFNIKNGNVAIVGVSEKGRKRIDINEINSEVNGFVLNKEGLNGLNDSLMALENLKISLGQNHIKIDSLNALKFSSLGFSTKDSVVSFEDFSLLPKQWIKTKNQPEFTFRHFDLKGVDFPQMYFNNNFKSRIIVADSGVAHYRIATKPDSIFAWSRINNFFDTIQVDQLVILNTQLHYEKIIGKRQPNLHLPIIKMGFDRLLIDSNAFFNEKKKFYSRNVDLNLGTFDLISKDSAQIITTKSLALSTLNRELLLFDISISPLKSNQKTSIEGNIRSVQIFGLDPLYVIQDRTIVGRAMLIEQPTITLKQGKIQGQKFSDDALNHLVKKQFKKASLSNVEIENANITYLNRLGTTIFKLDNSKLYCSDFNTYRGKVPSDKTLLSNWISAEGSNAFVRLNDNIHLANIYGFKVFSQKGGLYANKVNISVRDGLSDSMLQGKTVIKEAELFNTSIDGFDLKALSQSNSLKMSYVECKGANKLHLKISNDSTVKEKSLAGIYIDELNIDSVDAEIEIGDNQDVLLKSNGTLFQFCDLAWDTSYASGSIDLYSILLEGHDFGVKHSNSEHVLASKNIKINSSYGLAQLTGIDVRPIYDNFKGKNALWYSGTTFRLGGFDIPAYLKSRTLYAENAYFSKPSLAYHGVSDGDYKLDDFLKHPYDYLNSVFSKAQIDAFRIHNGKIHYTNHLEKKEIEYNLKDLSVYLESFVIDSFTSQTDTNIFFSKKAEIELNDFEQRANDTSMILSFGAVKMHPHNQKLWVENMQIKNRKPAESLGYFSINSDLGELTKFDYNSFLVDKQISMQKAEFIDPVLRVGLKNKTANNKEFFEKDIPKALTKNYSSIYTDSLVLKDAMFKVRYKEKESQKLAIESVDGWNATFQVFKVNRNYQNLDFLYSRAIKAEIEDYEKRLSDSLNTVKVGRLNVDVNRGRIYFDSVSMEPRYSKDLYAATYGKQIDRIEVFNQNSSIENFKFKDWLYNGNYTADELRVNRTEISVFTDKTLPENKATIKKMPQEILRDLPFTITLKETKLNNWSISYEEKPDTQIAPGIIYFNEFGGTITDISNDTAYLALKKKKDSITHVHIETKLMQNGNVILDMDIPMDQPVDEFTFSGSLDGMDMREINPLLISLTRIEIVQGRTHGMTFDGQANKYFASGEVDLRYSNLKVNIVGKEEGKRKLGDILLGAIANRFIIKDSNRLFPKKGKIDYVRKENKSIFNYGAKALLTGIKESIGLKNKEGVESLAEDEALPGEAYDLDNLDEDDN
ncbi:MAG: hypothetical protein JXQ87_10910 [Bacteroidia bacterium]